MKQKEKVYITGADAELLIDKFTKEINVLEEKLKAIQAEYISIGNNTKKKNLRTLKKLERLSRKERRISAKIQKRKVEIIHLKDGTYEKKNFLQKLLGLYRSLNYRNQKIVCGLVLLLPWIIGFCLFFAKPLLTTIFWSFNEVIPGAGKVTLHFNGIKNYIDLFRSQMLGSRTFLEVLFVSVQSMLIDVPVIFIFSLIIAVVLNTKFKGHQIFKAIFFIPVVYNATAISQALNGAFGGHMSASMTDTSNMLEGFSNYLLNIGLGEGLIKFLISAVDRIFTIVNKSGIQILIFIAALQSIPKHLYEAAKVEGATTYECFWKVTFPMVSPMFLPILVYSIVDCFVSSDLIRFMTVESGGATIGYGMASTIAIIYFLVNLLIIGIIFAILRKVVYSND